MKKLLFSSGQVRKLAGTSHGSFELDIARALYGPSVSAGEGTGKARVFDALDTAAALAVGMVRNETQDLRILRQVAAVWQAEAGQAWVTQALETKGPRDLLLLISTTEVRELRAEMTIRELAQSFEILPNQPASYVLLNATKILDLLTIVRVERELVGSPEPGPGPSGRVPRNPKAPPRAIERRGKRGAPEKKKKP